MGRKPVQAKEIVRVAEVMGIPLESDIMLMEDLADFPDLQNESKKNQLIIAAHAAGFTQADIGAAFGIKQNTVCDIIKRIDPNKMFRMSKGAKAEFTLRLLHSRKLSALSNMTPEKLKESSAVELARIAQSMVTIEQSITQSKHNNAGGTSQMAMLKDVIENERKMGDIEDAEIIYE